MFDDYIQNWRKSLGVVAVFSGIFLPGVDASANFEDVALNAETGDTFIIDRTTNPTGKLLLLNDFDSKFRQEMHLLPFAARDARFEIEMASSTHLAYLVQVDHLWYVNGLRKGERGWQMQPTMTGVSGAGEATGLTALPDGRYAVTVRSKSDRPGEVLILESDSTETDSFERFEIIEAVEESKVEKNVKTLAEEKKFESGNGLGFAGGLQSGVGLAYRRHFANKWGVQVAGVGYADSNYIFANLGATVMRTFSKTQYIRFYGLAGASVFYDRSKEYYPVSPVGCRDPKDPNSTEPPICYGEDGYNWVNSTSLNFGLGIGMEFTIARRLGLAVELPLTVILDLEKNDGVAFDGLYPIPNGSLIYYF